MDDILGYSQFLSRLTRLTLQFHVFVQAGEQLQGRVGGKMRACEKLQRTQGGHSKQTNRLLIHEEIVEEHLLAILKLDAFRLLEATPQLFRR